MAYFNIVAETNENTVVTEYKPLPRNESIYQSEVALEKEFIRRLEEQGYNYLPIHNEKDLIRACSHNRINYHCEQYKA